MRTHKEFLEPINNRSSRRQFILKAAGATVFACLPSFIGILPAGAEDATRKMKICLSTGMIGVSAKLADVVKYAAHYGFEAVEPSMSELAAMSSDDIKRFLDELKAKGLVWGAASTGVPIGQSVEAFNKWLAGLPKIAGALQQASVNRLSTWISCGDNKLTYPQNFRLHAKRIAEIATILGDSGIVFGLEYIGPKTSWARSRFPFIHTLQEMKELIADTGKKNVGLLLDSWHWYTAGETSADILTLRNSDVVNVHINDAPLGIPVDQQIDNRRGLPASTGVIKIGDFLGALQKIGYDGPVAAEPFDAELRKMPADQALQRTIDANHKAFQQLK